MHDITISDLTATKRPEHVSECQRAILEIAANNTKIICIHRKPNFEFGDVHIIDSKQKSYENIYRQMLVAAKHATTPFVAVAEDDVFYSREHFKLRPPLDTFLYNQARWALFTWGVPTYSMRNRKSNCSLIAPRELLIEALEERFAKYPDGMPKEFVGELGRERVEKGLGVTLRKSMEVFSEVPIIQFNHENASEERQSRRRKSLGQVKAFDIPEWGRADNLVSMFK